MKKYLTLLGFLVSVVTFSQQQYSEQEPTANMEGGIYYQTGPGSNNSVLNWEYPYGTKLTVSGSACCRNFELLSTSYPYGEFKLRQWDPTGNQWTQWRSILMENKDAIVEVGNLIGFKRADNKLVYGIGHSNNEFTIGRLDNIGPTAGTPLHIATGGYEIRFSVATEEQMRISRQGNVGIGTTTPAYKLDVASTVRVGDDNWGGLIVNGKAKNDWLFNAHNDGNTFGIRTQRDNGEASWAYQVMTFQRSTGNVGIGTTAPDSKLTVKGKIHTQEVKVDLAGAVAPDYVFLDDYDLKTLDEVSQHIQEKGHLPNIPSAKQMEKEGVNLKEMNLKLLEKIEELTLYTIAQEEKIKEHEEQNNNLKAELKSEKQRINLLEKKIDHILNQLQN